MSRTYPRLIHTYTGSGLIFKGHDLDTDQVLEQVRFELDPQATKVRTEQVWLQLHPRIKNCADYGAPCDLEGDWHAHWEEVRPSPGAAFTIAYPDTFDVAGRW